MIPISVFFFMMMLYIWLAMVTYAAISEAITSRGITQFAGAVASVLVWPLFWLALGFATFVTKVIVPAANFSFEKAVELGDKIGRRIS